MMQVARPMICECGNIGLARLRNHGILRVVAMTVAASQLRNAARGSRRQSYEARGTIGPNARAAKVASWLTIFKT